MAKIVELSGKTSPYWERDNTRSYGGLFVELESSEEKEAAKALGYDFVYMAYDPASGEIMDFLVPKYKGKDGDCPTQEEAELIIELIGKVLELREQAPDIRKRS